MLEHELEKCFKVGVEVAKNVGKLIREAYSQEKRVETKCSVADLVTETDQQVEKMIISTLRENFPTHSFIGEESTAAGEHCELTDNPTWIIDPIDGTSNFVHRFPFTCVSIGFLVNKKPEVGIVYNPITDHMYTARPGQGAFCNDTRLHVSKTTDLGQSMVCAEFGSGREPEKMDSKFRTMRSVLEKVHGLRSLGSAAMSMCMIAAGNGDAYYEQGIHCWDIAAGDLIVREAGGFVGDTTGGPLDLMSRRVLCAATKELGEQLAKNIEHIEYERD